MASERARCMMDETTRELVNELAKRLKRVTDKEFFIIYCYVNENDIAIMTNDEHDNQIYTFDIDKVI